MRHDAIAQTLDLDLQYGLHAPSLETVLHMIPESILQKKEVSVKGEVAFKGELKGTYGNKNYHWPHWTSKLRMPLPGMPDCLMA